MTFRVGYNVVLLAAIVSVAISFGNSFAEEKFTHIEGDNIKNNPKAQDILKKIEESKQRIKELKESRQKQIEHQKFIKEQREIAQANLQEELKAMNKKYEGHNPRNAFSSFVGSVNSMHHKIYWDQFNYLDAKVKVANDARNKVLENGGSYSEAQLEYYRYVSMPRVEMIQVIQDLNVRHQFSDDSMQSYFDVYGKLPRFEEYTQSSSSPSSPSCYGCQKYEEIKDKMFDSEEIPEIKFESKSTKKQSNHHQDNSQDINVKLKSLRDRLSELRDEFVREDDMEHQKSLINSMNSVIKEMQELKQNEKNL